MFEFVVLLKRVGEESRGRRNRRARMEGEMERDSGCYGRRRCG